MKKLLAMGASVAMLFATAAPVFAQYWPPPVQPTTNTSTIVFDGNGMNLSAISGKNLSIGAIGTGVIEGGVYGTVTNTGGLTQRITTGNSLSQGQQIVQLSPTGCDTCQSTSNTVYFRNNGINLSAISGENAVAGGVVTGSYHALTGGITNTGAVSQGVTSGLAQSVGNQWVITGVTTTTPTTTE